MSNMNWKGFAARTAKMALVGENVYVGSISGVRNTSPATEVFSH